MKILEQENSHLHKLLELTEYDSTNTAALTSAIAQCNVPNQILNGEGGRGILWFNHAIFRSLDLNHEMWYALFGNSS